MLRVALPTLTLLALLLVPTGVSPSPHDHQGEIVLGTGDLKLRSTVDHAYLYSPVGAIGFNLQGDVEYEYVSVFDSSGDYYRVILMAPLGAHHVPWTLDWVTVGQPQVRFDGLYATTCVGLLCTDPVLP